MIYAALIVLLSWSNGIPGGQQARLQAQAALCARPRVAQVHRMPRIHYRVGGYERF